jgi:TetR/AcrR family transcriptional regulator
MGVAERKEREKEQRRNLIIDAAEKVFFSKGVETATMDEVAHVAEYSKGTLYLYFKNKDELFLAIMERALSHLSQRFMKVLESDKCGLDKIHDIGKAYFEFYKEEPDYFSVMLHKEIREVTPEAVKGASGFARCNEIGNQLFFQLQEAVRLGIADGSIRNDLDPVKLSLVLWGHSAGVLHIFKTKEPIMESMLGASVEEIVEYSNQLIMYYLENKERK